MKRVAMGLGYVLLLGGVLGGVTTAYAGAVVGGIAEVALGLVLGLGLIWWSST